MFSQDFKSAFSRLSIVPFHQNIWQKKMKFIKKLILLGLLSLLGCKPYTQVTDLPDPLFLSSVSTPTLFVEYPNITEPLTTPTIFPDAMSSSLYETVSQTLPETPTSISTTPSLNQTLQPTKSTTEGHTQDQYPLLISLSLSDGVTFSTANLYPMNLNGVIGQPLTNPNQSSYYPTWSPDCQQIAFVQNLGDYDGEAHQYLFIMNILNQDTTLVEIPFQIIRSPNWSQDGKYIVFEGDNGISPQIYVLDLTNNDLRQLTHVGNNGSPDWSPDGQSIVYLNYDDSLASSIHIMDRNGENSRQLVPNQWGSDTAKDPIRYAPKDPVWSPDNEKIAFTVEESTFIYGFRAYKIYIMDADGSSLHRLIEGDSENTDTGSENFYYISELNPVWSPDGQTILYLSLETYRPELGNRFCFANILGDNLNCITIPDNWSNLDIDWCSLPSTHIGGK